MTDFPSGGPSESKGVAFTNWLVSKAAGVLERKSSRRGFIMGSAMVGSAVAVAGCAPGTQPGTPYSHITDCAGGLCTDGYTEFCCTINSGLNVCPTGSFIGGWWRADYSSFCSGTRYYMDCMQNCCGPDLGNGFCAGCTECSCGGGCDTRRIYCNYFRYGQCHQEIGITGPIVCRVVTCVPPYTIADYVCTMAAAVDNSTVEHVPVHGCAPPAPPAPLPVPVGVSSPAAGNLAMFYRGAGGNIFGFLSTGGTSFQGGQLGPAVTSAVASASDATGISAFGRGFGDALWYNCLANNAWSGPQVFGGVPLTSDRSRSPHPTRSTCSDARRATSCGTATSTAAPGRGGSRCRGTCRPTSPRCRAATDCTSRRAGRRSALDPSAQRRRVEHRDRARRITQGHAHRGRHRHGRVRVHPQRRRARRGPGATTARGVAGRRWVASGRDRRRRRSTAPAARTWWRTAPTGTSSATSWSTGTGPAIRIFAGNTTSSPVVVSATSFVSVFVRGIDNSTVDRALHPRRWSGWSSPSAAPSTPPTHSSRDRARRSRRVVGLGGAAALLVVALAAGPPAGAVDTTTPGLPQGN